MTGIDELPGQSLGKQLTSKLKMISKLKNI